MRLRWITAGSLLSYALLAIMVTVPLTALVRLDEAVSADALRYGLAHPAAVTAMRAVTRTGDTLPLLIGGAVLVGALAWRGRRREALFVLASVAGAAVLSRGVRAVLRRPRPQRRLAEAHGFGFPSGHATNAAVAALIAGALLLPALRGAGRRAALVGALAAWAALVGVSRVALVVHWPSDLLGGWLAASAAVGLALLLVNRGQSPVRVATSR